MPAFCRWLRCNRVALLTPFSIHSAKAFKSLSLCKIVTQRTHHWCPKMTLIGCRIVSWAYPGTFQGTCPDACLSHSPRLALIHRQPLRFQLKSFRRNSYKHFHGTRSSDLYSLICGCHIRWRTPKDWKTSKCWRNWCKTWQQTSELHY